MDYKLNIDEKYYNTLYIEGFSQMMKDPSYCYKFYWLEAIVILISEGVHETTFDAIIDEMICNAWYSVREYHIHLSAMQANGTVADGLERAIIKLSELENLSSGASKIELKNAIKRHQSELKDAKSQLTNMVPYRALAGFFNKVDEGVDWGSVRRMTEYIRHINKDIVLLPYTLGESSKLNKEIYFQHDWFTMIQDNTVSILGWIQYEKMKWLQSINPEVPGLVYKLDATEENTPKLKNVHKLWEGILACIEIRDVFTGEFIESNNYDLDHFIPRSFMMNDEVWDLMPMNSSLNSSKSNKLPYWEPYFIRFASNQYSMYQLIYEKASIQKLFLGCYKDNLHSIWAAQELYRKGNSKEDFIGILQKNMQPVYDSARRQGYEIWNR